MTLPARATRRQWIGLAVLALPCMLYSMDLTVLNLAVPSLSAALKPSASQLLWIVDIYGFMVAGFLITMGNLGDRIGRRRLLLIGASAFGAASVLAAFSTSAGMLIAMRALLGIAGATLAPSTLSLIRLMFADPAQRSVAIGIWISSYSVGAAIGPVLGGLLLQWFWWGSVFLISVPVMVLLLAVGPWLLPEFRDPDARPLDVPSAALSIIAVLLAVFACKQIAAFGIGGAAGGLADGLTVVCGLVGVGFGVAFLRRQHRLANPLIDLRLFGNPAFRIAIVTYTLGCFVLFGIFFFIAQQLQAVLGLSPFEAGLWSVPSSLAFVVGSMSMPRVSQRFGKRAAIVGGLCLAATGLVLMTWAATRAGPAGIAVASVFQALGLAPVFALATDLVVSGAPPERAGAASAISETSSELGGALGIAMLGSLGTAVYHAGMGNLTAIGVPPTAAATARGALGAAVEVAQQLGGAPGVALLGAAREAFVSSLQVASSVSAVLLIVAALLTARVLPRSA